MEDFNAKQSPEDGKQLIAQLRMENAALRDENTTLKQQCVTLGQRILSKAVFNAIKEDTISSDSLLTSITCVVAVGHSGLCCTRRSDCRWHQGWFTIHEGRRSQRYTHGWHVLGCK
jgi:hypothetical protein